MFVLEKFCKTKIIAWKIKWSISTGHSERIYQFTSNNRASFHLWWKENLFNHQKVTKYYEHDCSFKQIQPTRMNTSNSSQKFVKYSEKLWRLAKNTICIKLIIRLRLGFSHIREQKFKHNFQETLNPLCSGSMVAESTSHYFLRCHFFDVLLDTI